MMISLDEFAAAMVAELHRRLNRAPAIEAVDFVDCETTDDVMCYIYTDDGACEPILIEQPPPFDADDLAAAMMRRAVPVVMH